MTRAEGKGIVVPEELLRAGAVVAEDEQGVCVYVDAEAGEEVAELARRFLGGNVVSGFSDGVVWYRPIHSVPGLLDALVGDHDADIAKAREAGRAPEPKPEATPCPGGDVSAASEQEMERAYTAYLERSLDAAESNLLRAELAAAKAAVALLRRMLTDGPDEELLDISDDLCPGGEL